MGDEVDEGNSDELTQKLVTVDRRGVARQEDE